MKVLVIGDIHGRTDWKQLLEIEHDEVVFLGDYLDSWNEPQDKILNNFKDIIEYKKANPDTVTLLLGNHELSYLYPDYRCSGYDANMYLVFNELLVSNLDLFEVMVIKNGCTISHAGITERWLKDFIIEYEEFCDRIEADKKLRYKTPLPKMLKLAVENSFKTIHQSGRRGNTSKAGSIFWADKTETRNDAVPNRHQIVGHTAMREMHSVDLPNDSTVTYIDLIEKTGHILLD